MKTNEYLLTLTANRDYCIMLQPEFAGTRCLLKIYQPTVTAHIVDTDKICMLYSKFG